MAKTPYELRFDIVQLALGQLRDEYFAAQERHNNYQHNEHVPFIQAYPTLDDGLVLAAKIQKFVNEDK